MDDFKLIQKEDDSFIIQCRGEVVRVCGCCGKKLDAKAAAVLMAKLQAGTIGWRVLYETGIAAEFREKQDDRTKGG